jgi:hypothetical protein
MNNSIIPTLTEEVSKRKRKILTDPERIFACCQVCKEPGNLENMLRKQIPVKDERGVELYRGFNYVYLCSENCLGLFN